MRNIILTMLATFVVAGCGGSSGDSGSANATPGSGSGGEAPVSVGVSKPPTEVPEVPDDGDQLQACVAIQSVKLTNLAGEIVEWTTRSMNGEVKSSEQCIPEGSEIPVYDDGTPKFIVIDLHDITGVDLVDLISEQLVPVGEYVSMALSLARGEYEFLDDLPVNVPIDEFMGVPYSYVGSWVDNKVIDDDLTFDGLNININAPEKFVMTFDFRSMFKLVENAYKFKQEAFQLLNEKLSGSIFGDIDLSSCPTTDNAYVYLYESNDEQEKYGDLGSNEYTPTMTAKVTEENNYTMPYVPAGNYDVVLVCDGLLDLPDQIDLDIDLDGDSPKYTDQQLAGGEDKYLPL
ncbi:DUF4382 domain-containing protein [Photobacterium sp. OFAV2-7]|uniref:DUF4382 domain-containing protein n=1 Tax=Photobacterium sp. OFAV2-7 TaxID=2917748 RepID=UPI001EF48F00|nr:DUF4382 domain-containing protein [Photobacterium sp. OFAV2-7]MCG7585372.1 DUF4382 domain-containing protein [Photobacterium sp. OFAV2-7]